MNSETTWQKAERLRSELEREQVLVEGAAGAARARDAIGVWLDKEFSPSPAEDAAQLRLQLDTATRNS